MKEFKVRNPKGEYLSFNLRGSIMDPTWGPISMSYTFTEAEANGFAQLYAATISPKPEWESEQRAALDRIFGRKG